MRRMADRVLTRKSVASPASKAKRSTKSDDSFMPDAQSKNRAAAEEAAERASSGPELQPMQKAMLKQAKEVLKREPGNRHAQDIIDSITRGMA